MSRNPSPHTPAPVLLVMGVSGSGKSTLARALAEALEGRYLDADDFHPPENVAKMSAGIPLTDGDREGWLATLNQMLRAGANRGELQVLACSALKHDYRVRLGEGISPVYTVFLHGSREQLEQRLSARTGHFMPVSLLDSQLIALEPPSGPNVIRVPLEWSVEDAVARVRQRLGE